ncbi:MAG TPA: hypothetical protein VFZ27_08060 [Terriglobia bacterium]|nr:hypothetical protein [Terriglobia bacterium]
MQKTLQWAARASAQTIILLLLTAFIQPGSGTALAAQNGNDEPQVHRDYSTASINGSYAFVGTYAGLIASSFGVVTFNGLGSAQGSVIVNQPNADGSRNVSTVGLTGTYFVNRDGTGTLSYLVTLADGHTANVTEDLLITKAETHRGMLTATSFFEAQRQPSVVLSGEVYATHTYTRRPD